MEMILDNVFYYLRIELFTTEYVKVSITGLIAKVTCDVGRFNELDKSVACLVSFSEKLNHRLTVGDHVNLFHNVFSKVMDDEFVVNEMGRTFECVDDCVKAPGHIRGAEK